MNNTGLPTLRKGVMDGRFRRSVMVAMVSATLVATTAGPASAVARQRPRTTPVSLAVGDSLLYAASRTVADHHVRIAGRDATIDTLGTETVGIDSRVLTNENTLAAGLNQLLGHDVPAADESARDGVALNVATATPAAFQDTSITLLPGIVLTINDAGIQLSLSNQAVTEVESVVGFGESVASLVGSILDAAGVPLGGQIAEIVASALGVGDAFLKVCTAGDGSATFSITWFGLPSCSGLSLLV